MSEDWQAKWKRLKVSENLILIEKKIIKLREFYLKRKTKKIRKWKRREEKRREDRIRREKTRQEERKEKMKRDEQNWKIENR